MIVDAVHLWVVINMKTRESLFCTSSPDVAENDITKRVLEVLNQPGFDRTGRELRLNDFSAVFSTEKLQKERKTSRASTDSKC